MAQFYVARFRADPLVMGVPFQPAEGKDPSHGRRRCARDPRGELFDRRAVGDQDCRAVSNRTGADRAYQSEGAPWLKGRLEAAVVGDHFRACCQGPKPTRSRRWSVWTLKTYALGGGAVGGTADTQGACAFKLHLGLSVASPARKDDAGRAPCEDGQQ